MAYLLKGVKKTYIPKPETKKEIYFCSIINGIKYNLPYPVTRKEIYLAKAAGLNIQAPEPRTREEMYLYAIAEKMAEKGG